MQFWEHLEIPDRQNTKMNRRRKIYLYVLISLGFSLVLAKSTFYTLTEYKHSEYSSLTTQVGLATIFLGVSILTVLSIFFRNDRFLKHRTTFIYTFVGILNLSFSITYLLFSYTLSDNKYLAIGIGCMFFLIGGHIIRNLIKGSASPH